MSPSSWANSLKYNLILFSTFLNWMVYSLFVLETWSFPVSCATNHSMTKDLIWWTELKFTMKNMENMVGYTFDRASTTQTLRWTCNLRCLVVVDPWPKSSEMSMTHPSLKLCFYLKIHQPLNSLYLCGCLILLMTISQVPNCKRSQQNTRHLTSRWLRQKGLCQLKWHSSVTYPSTIGWETHHLYLKQLFCKQNYWDRDLWIILGFFLNSFLVIKSG